MLVLLPLSSTSHIHIVCVRLRGDETPHPGWEKERSLRWELCSPCCVHFSFFLHFSRWQSNASNTLCRWSFLKQPEQLASSRTSGPGGSFSEPLTRLSDPVPELLLLRGNNPGPVSRDPSQHMDRRGSCSGPEPDPSGCIGCRL